MVNEPPILFIPKRKTINRTLVIGFSIAVGLHLIALFVFRITPFQTELTKWQFPPVQIEPTQNLKDLRSHTTSHSSSQFITSRIPKPASPEPQEALQLKPIHTVQAHTKYQLPTAPPPSVKIPPNVRLILSGSLQSIPLQTKPKLPTPKQDVALIYDVRLDHRTGQLSYIKPLHAKHPPEIEKIGQNALKELRFQPHEGFTSSGTIEIHLLGAQQ